MSTSPLQLTELLQNVKDALKSSLSKSYWVRAEISEISVNYSGHCYLELIEKQENSENISAKVRGTIWSTVYRMLSAYFEAATGQSLDKGMKILIKVSVEFSELYGLSVNILDIDPTYTIGEQERIRREIIKRLEDDGVMDMNSMLELPQVIQRIAILSSNTAAGFGDFMDQLSNNERAYSFQCTLFPCIMQGQKTADSIISNLEKIFENENDFDAVVIIRGGGSKTDLAWFDNYDLAVNIAQFPLPVISGIGHERDLSIADMVSHTNLKTPTAVAEWIIDHASTFEDSILSLAAEFSDAVNDLLNEHKSELQHLSQTLIPLVTDVVSEYSSELQTLTHKAERFSNNRLKSEKERTKVRSINAIHHSNIKILKLQQYIAQIQTSAKHSFKTNVSNDEHHLETIAEKSYAFDPTRILERGFTMTLDANGKLIRSAKSIKLRQEITTRFVDGEIKTVRL
jgi:exodeoxyribonuclease VII large subunit